jgi:hypothetical protein
VIETSPLFTTQMDQFAALTLRHQVPAIYQLRAFAARGGLLKNRWLGPLKKGGEIDRSGARNTTSLGSGMSVDL